jgi:methyl-accepting chemotaxis protein
MSDELVKRWDEYVESMGCVMGDVEHMSQQMRDRIEQLVATNEALTEQLDAARDDAKEAEAYAEELEAKLAKVVARDGGEVNEQTNHIRSQAGEGGGGFAGHADHPKQRSRSGYSKGIRTGIDCRTDRRHP